MKCFTKIVLFEGLFDDSNKNYPYSFSGVCVYAK